MNSLLIAPAIMVGIGLFFGTILAIAQRFLKVDEDPRIEVTNELLPGTNCGACGQPGCLPFAEKLVAGDVDPSQCTVSISVDSRPSCAITSPLAGATVGGHVSLVFDADSPSGSPVTSTLEYFPAGAMGWLTMTAAPRKRSILRRSRLKLSAIVTTSG